MSRLQDLCKERGFTQIKMQMLTGIDQSAYSQIERGERYLSFEQCRRVALALNTSMDYLAGLTDEKKPYPRAEQSRAVSDTGRSLLYFVRAALQNGSIHIA